MSIKVVLSPQYKQYGSFIHSIPSIFNKEEVGVLVHNGRNQIKFFTMNDGTVLAIKHFHRPNIAQRIAYGYFTPSKAKKAYEFAHRFRTLDVDTPEEIAYIEIRNGGLLIDCYFISLQDERPSIWDTLYPNGATPDTIVQNGIDVENYNYALIDAFADFLASIHEKGILHGDLNLGNILYDKDNEGQYRFSCIDINRTKFKYPIPINTCLQNMVRITKPRIIYKHILYRYAHVRQWDEEKILKKGLHYLDAFLKNRARTHEIKYMLGLKKRLNK